MDDDTQKRIHYFIKDPQKFVGQTVGVFGGGDSALDLALELANYANVKIIHRRNQFRGLESNVKKLKSLKNVEILSNIPTVLCGLNIDIGRYDIPSAQKRGLFVKNTGIENNNDKKWNELNKEFKLFNKLKGKV